MEYICKSLDVPKETDSTAHTKDDEQAYCRRTWQYRSRYRRTLVASQSGAPRSMD